MADKKEKIHSIVHQLVSPYSILYNIKEISLKPGDLELYCYVGKSGVVNRKCGGIISSTISGAGITKEEALFALLGESVERYSWICPPKDKVIISSELNLSNKFLSIKDTPLLFRRDLSPEDVLRKLSTIKIPWLPAKRLSDGSEILVPLIDLFPEILPSKVRDWTISTTNGIAAHTIYEKACLHAIYEVIERDATMQFWYRKKQNKKAFHLNNHCNLIDRLIEKSKLLGLRIEILDITTDLQIPSALAYAYYGKKGSECFACGSASRLSLQEAGIKALIELAAMWNSLQDFKKYKNPLAPKEKLLGFPNIDRFEDHVFLYTHSWAKSGYKFLLNSKFFKGKIEKMNDISQSESPKKELKILVNLLESKGYEVYILDITPEDIKTLGFYVVKAIVPGLVPLFVGQYKPLYCSRLPEKEIINEWPHPFP